MGIVGREHAGRHRHHHGVVAHGAASSTFVAVPCSTLFSWNGVSSGCLPRIRAQMPVMCGVAKLLPLQRSVEPPIQGTSRSRPGAKNSTGGGRGLKKGGGALLAGVAPGSTDEKPPRGGSPRQLWGGGPN